MDTLTTQLSLDKLEQELLDYFYEHDIPKKKQYMSKFHKRRVECTVCGSPMKQSQLYYHLKRVHGTTAKNLTKNQYGVG